MARAFLAEVARQLGREEVECPFIRRLVVEEWLDSLEDLQALPLARWEAFRLEYRLPARFVDAVVAALHSPSASSSLSVRSAARVVPPVRNDAQSSLAAVGVPSSEASQGVALQPPSSSSSSSAHSAVTVAASDGRSSAGSTSASSSSSAAATGLVAKAELPMVKPEDHDWAKAKRFAFTAQSRFWGEGKNAMTDALERVLLQDENIRTYGILGKTLDQATLGAVAAFAKAGWVGGKGGSLEPGSANKDLYEDLLLFQAVDAPQPPPGKGYGAALVLGDCSQEELRVRLECLHQLSERGALGTGTPLHVCVGVKVSGTLQASEAAEAQARGDINTMLSEVFGVTDAAASPVRTHIVRVTSIGDATPLLRYWLRDSTQVQPGSPLLIVSSQPYALMHQLKAERVIREKRAWFDQWPPWLIHVSAQEAPSSIPSATLLDAVGRTLGEMDALSRKKKAPKKAKGDKEVAAKRTARDEAPIIEEDVVAQTEDAKKNATPVSRL